MEGFAIRRRGLLDRDGAGSAIGPEGHAGSGAGSGTEGVVSGVAGATVS